MKYKFAIFQFNLQILEKNNNFLLHNEILRFVQKINVRDQNNFNLRYDILLLD